MKSSVIEFNVPEGNGRGAKNKNRQITGLWTGRQLLISRSQSENRQEITFNTFNSSDKKTTPFHALKIQHGTMPFKDHHLVRKISSGRKYISIFF